MNNSLFLFINLPVVFEFLAAGWNLEADLVPEFLLSMSLESRCAKKQEQDLDFPALLSV